MAKAVGFTEASAKRIARVVRSVERAAPPGPARGTPATPAGIYRPSFWRIAAVATAGAGGEYTVRKQAMHVDTRALADVSDTTDPDFQLDRPGWTPDVGVRPWRVDLIYRGELFYDGYGQWGVLLDLPAVFPVTLSQTGGSAGTDTAQCSYTYTVAELVSGTSLATAVNPTSSPHRHQRPTVGLMLEATAGLATFGADGELAVMWINEVPDQEAC